MLMKPDKKKNMASLILGSASQGPMDEMKSSNEDMNEASQMDEGLLAAADEVLQAIESKDAKSLAEAMKYLIEMCQSEPSEPSLEG